MEQLYRARLESKFSFQPIRFDVSGVPEIRLPDLDEIHVVVPVPDRPSDTELQLELESRWKDLLYAGAKTSPREKGEPVKMGDRIMADLITYVGGHIYEPGVRRNVELVLESGMFVPQFGEAVAGTPVGETVLIQATFPDDYPDLFLQGRKVALSVFVRNAEGLSIPNVDDPAFLAQQGVQTAEDLTQRLLAEIQSEIDLDYQLAGIRMALEQLGEYALPAVSEEMIDAAIKNRWLAEEGNYLKTSGVPVEDCREALDQWLQDTDLREQILDQLSISLAVRALGIREGLMQPSVEEFESFVRDLSGQMGLGDDAVAEFLAQDSDVLKPLHEQFVYTRVVEYIFQQVRVTYER